MSWTKRQLIEQAFDAFGLANYVFDLSPEQLQSALRRMDAMMASWESRGIRVGYMSATDPDQSDLDQASGVTDQAYEAVYMNLAVRLAPSIGKVLSHDTKTQARAAYDFLMSKVMADIPEMQYPSHMPAGQGNKPWRFAQGPFLPEPVDVLIVGQDGSLEIE